MKLSRKAIRILKWMNRNDEPKYLHWIETVCKDFDDRAFTALESAKYVIGTTLDDEIPERDPYGNEYTPRQYQITDAGRAFVESRVIAWLPEIQGWVVVAASVVSMLTTILSTIYMILRG